MNKYEAMMILPETIKDDEFEKTLDRVAEEIEKLGGKVASKTRLGKRAFARRMQKKDGGYYAIVSFAIDPDQIPALLARYKMNEDVFRVQIVRATEAPAQAEVAGAGKEKADGDAK